VKQIVRWGILGPGSISGAFATGLKEAEGAALVAVGSRSHDRAKKFAAEYGVPNIHGSYEALASDSDVDAVYIGTPHTFHEEHTILCLRQGKHVLCEKPFAINAKQARRMIQCARDEDRLLMEAMWTRFLPAIELVKDVVTSGRIGTPRTLMTDFGFRAEFDPTSRLFDPQLGGGTLLDLGVYPITLAYWLFGRPVDIRAMANLGETGVDEEASILLRHGEGQMTAAVTSFRVDTPKEAMIRGTEGWIRIHEPWWGGRRVTIGSKDGDTETIDLPFRGGGYTYEAEAFMEIIREGGRDSKVMPLDESLAIMETMDTIRDQWDLQYPME